MLFDKPTRKKWSHEPQPSVRPNGSDHLGYFRPQYEKHEVFDGTSWVDLDEYRSRQDRRSRRVVLSQPSRVSSGTEVFPVAAIGALFGSGIFIGGIIVIWIVYEAIYETLSDFVAPSLVYAWIPAWGAFLSIVFRIWMRKYDFSWWGEMTGAWALSAATLLVYYMCPWLHRHDLMDALLYSSIASLMAGFACVGMWALPNRVRERFVGWKPKFLRQLL